MLAQLRDGLCHQHQLLAQNADHKQAETEHRCRRAAFWNSEAEEGCVKEELASGAIDRVGKHSRRVQNPLDLSGSTVAGEDRRDTEAIAAGREVGGRDGERLTAPPFGSRKKN